MKQAKDIGSDLELAKLIEYAQAAHAPAQDLTSNEAALWNEIYAQSDRAKALEKELQDDEAVSDDVYRARVREWLRVRNIVTANDARTEDIARKKSAAVSAYCKAMTAVHEYVTKHYVPTLVR